MSKIRFFVTIKLFLIEQKEGNILGTEINVFNENVDYLKAARDELLKLEKMRRALESLKAEDKRIQRAIATEEKSISDEIEQTLKTRQEEIADTYDKELENNMEKTKRLNAKRNQTKTKRINERVEQETAGVREENRLLLNEMKTLFKQEHVPAFCNTKLYYAMFMTKGIGEIFKFLLTLIIGLFAIPGMFCLVGRKTFLATVKQPILSYVIIYAIFIVLFFIIYIIIINNTKVKYRDTLIEGRKIKEKIRANHKQIKAITNSVTKDKDESKYGLDDYDRKLKELQDEASNIATSKQEALTIFENETQKVIIDEIQKRREGALNALEEKYQDVEEKSALGEEAVAKQKVFINQHYEAYLGKDFMKLDKLADLISIMEEGDAETVSDAIAFYKS